MLVTLITNIVLARILGPFEFGQVGIVMFFILIAKVLSESGLSGALVRKRDATETDYSTVFIFNLGISMLLAGLLFFSSQFIASFYDNSKLSVLIQVSCVIILLYAFQNIQKTILIKNLEFKKKAFYELISVIPSSIISIISAYQGLGVWSILIFYISNNIILGIILWRFEYSINKIVFDTTSFKQFYKFGINTTAASLLDTFFDNIYQLILGKYFSLNQTGLFYQGKKLQEIPVGLIKSTALGVMFSSLSKLQYDNQKFNEFYEKANKQLTILTGLICLLLIVYAETIISKLYGVKWIDSTYYLQLLSIASFFYIQEIFNRLIFKVFDQTKNIIILEVVKKIIQSSTIVLGLVSKSIEILLYGFIFTSICSYFLNYYYSIKLYDKFRWKTIFQTLSIFLLVILTILGTKYFVYLFQLEENTLILLLPIIVCMYLCLVYFSQISNPFKDIKEIKKILLQK